MSSFALRKVVESDAPFHSTTVPEAKPLPFTVKVNAAPPAVTVAGVMEVITGAGRMVKLTEFEVMPLVVRVTGTVPDVVIRLAGTAAVT